MPRATSASGEDRVMWMAGQPARWCMAMVPALLLTACPPSGNDDDNDNDTAVVDASVPSDGATTQDGAVPVDGSANRDGATVGDAASPGTDGGIQTDAGVHADASTHVDGAVVVDAAVGDAGAMVDGAVTWDASSAADAGSGSDGAVDIEDAGGDEADGGEVLPDILPGQWCSLVAQTRCHAEQNCPRPAGSGPSLGDCIAQVSAWCGNHLLDVMATSGWIEINQQAAQSCLNGWNSLDCVAFNRAGRDERVVPGCATAITGLQDKNEPCVYGPECRSGLCLFDNACPGQCAGLAATGSSCDDQTVCAQGMDGCVNGMCTALPAEEGELCPNGLCRFPLICQTNESAPDAWRCRAFALESEPCGPGERICNPDLLCLRANLMGVGTCSSFRQENQPCFRTSDCLDPAGRTLVCSGAVCHVAPGVDEPCVEYMCHNAWCDSTALPPQCQAFSAAQESCPADFRCQPDLYCAESGTCQTRLAPGADCSSAPTACSAGDFCMAGRCVQNGMPICQPL